MQFRKVTAIIQPQMLEKVEKKLQDIGVGGISVTKITGFGEYANFYTRDWMDSTRHARIDIFTEKARAKSHRRRYFEGGAPGYGVRWNSGCSPRRTDIPYEVRP